MSSSNVLSDKDVNNSLKNLSGAGAGATKADVKSMEYHRQVLKSKMEEENSAHQYVSPSDDIMSPCTAKLNALKGRQAGKAKPKSLFAQASAKRFVGENVLGARNASLTTSSNNNNDNDNPRTD
ncbi:putative spo12-like protein [Rosellinia necatrix]|uniref:Putative spo12-like protein n=1 Tax=Rosellinia necatrix TaxID=77044 RepID=A0A1S7ULH9_ROSNE|nr:putative spo12-like protein [Rosellinia necatrix]